MLNAALLRRRRGPKPDPNCKTNTLKRLRQHNRNEKAALRETAAHCTWATSTAGGLRATSAADMCCLDACCDQYEPALIALLRRYYHTLDTVGKRTFLADRTVQHHANPGLPIAGQRLLAAFLEEPTVLHASLLQLGAGEGIPVPGVDGVRPVCKRFLNFATNGHNDTTYDFRFRRAKGESLTEADVSLRRIPAKAIYPQRAKPKHLSIDAFLRREGERGMILPNNDVQDNQGRAYQILPWPSKRAVHHAYVTAEEMRLDVPWKHLPVKAAKFTKHEHIFRYGNPFCGKLHSLPVSPEIASFEYFCHVWHSSDELCAQVRLRKWIPFAKCNECVVYRRVEDRARRGFKVPPEERRAARESHAAHLELVHLERRHYYSNRLRAELHPNVYLSVIIDGADQNKHKIPYFCEQSHASDETARQQLHAYGCLAHGRKAYCFLVPGHVKQGHDTTIEVLWHVILDTLDAEGRLPPVLLVQLDNTTKQNKGRYFFAFIALLVHHRIFEKVLVSFLPVGHTHEDIDQMFSRFATYLRHHDACSRADMKEAFENGFWYNNRPCDVRVLETLANMSAFLDKDTDISMREITGHRHFRVRLNKEGHVIVQARSTPIVSYESEPWQGLQGHTTELEIFAKGVPDIVKAMSEGTIPPAAAPGSGRLDHQAVSDIVTSLQRMRQTYKGQFTDEQFQDCVQMARLHLEPPRPFSWDPGPSTYTCADDVLCPLIFFVTGRDGALPISTTQRPASWPASPSTS